ncbi:MAG: 4Fe-4S dicluster domain-containing protein, partial [Bacteroidota bacterium]
LGLLAAAGFSRGLPAPASAKTRSWKRLLRPPGALAEESFNRTCDRCGQCLLACPTKCLVPAGLEAGLEGFWTPRFIPRRGRCMLCDACDLVCPTGALAPVSPEGIRMGTAEILRNKCVAWALGRRCFVCIEVCSKFAIKAETGNRPVVIEDRCLGCGACEANCPIDGAAIQVVSRGEIRRRG